MTSHEDADLDLLTLRSRWTADLASSPADHERLRGLRLVVVSDGRTWRLLPGTSLPDAVLGAVRAVLDSGSPNVPTPSAALLDALRPAVERRDAPRFDGGPVYVFGDAVRTARPAAHDGVTVVTSSAGGTSPAMLDAARPRSWDDGEWRELLDCGLGPWAAAFVDGRVVSLTHTSRPMLAGAAECGAWTDPAFRGHGLAGLVTAAWADVAGAPGRALFYGTDHRNTASQSVARRLGLRHVGWQWTISAEPWVEGDAWGAALLDHHRGRWTPMPELETDAFAVGDAMHPEWFFRPFDAWDAWERELLPLAVRGPALDLGAGAGRASLWLQAQGIDVTAVDSSPGAAQVCRERGVADVRVGDLNEPPADKPWRAILLLCGNLGLGGSREGNRRLLRRLAEVAAPDAVLVGDTVEPFGAPDIGLRIRYKGLATPWWRQRNVPVAEIPSLVEGTGWVLDRHVVEPPDHAVLLRRAGPT